MDLTTLVRQVARARRRLVLGTLLGYLTWFWFAALAVSALWFFVQPYLVAAAPDWLRWAVLAGLTSTATVAAFFLALRRASSQVSAALAVDERFGLRERVTTSLTLGPDEAATPAGKALLDDAHARASQVRIPDRFPIKLPWKPAVLVPVLAAAVVLLGLFWGPQPAEATSDDPDNPSTALDAKQDIDKEMKKLASKPTAKKDTPPAPKSKDLEDIQAMIDQFTRKPHDNREEVRDRIKDATAIEEAIQKQQQEQARRAEAMKEAMKQAERLVRKKRKEQQKGPAKNAADAMARGDMDKAKEELERLSREMEKQEQEKERLKRKRRDPRTSDEEKQELDRELDRRKKDEEDLQKQLEDMKEQLERLSRKKEDVEKELKEMEKNGEIDKEELERELEDLKKNGDSLSDEEKKELEEAAKELGECEKCMKEGKDGEAAKKMAKAAERMGKAGNKDGENEERARMLQRMRQVKKVLSRSLNRNKGGVGAGRRPLAEDKGDTKAEEKFVPGERGKGKHHVVGDGPMGGRKFDGPRKPSDLKEEIKQAEQEAAAAIDRQRLPPSARKMTRDYFDKLRGQDRDAKKR